MIAFEIAKNGKRLGKVEVGKQGMLMAMAQWLRSIDEKGRVHESAVVMGSSNALDGEESSKFTEPIEIGDIITIRVFDTDNDELMGAGIPVVRQPPELPPGRNLFSN